jgi:uncharacterized membrane-anchored protein
MRKVALLALLAALLIAPVLRAQDSADPRVAELGRKIRALDWVKGPRTISMAGNSALVLPEDYVYLDAANTAKFMALTQNLASGREVMVAPRSLQWAAYFVFDDAGYVKDNEKIDPDAILKALQQRTEDANAVRRERGYPELHVIGWSIPPAYNSVTKRLEWATLLQSPRGEATNFFTKILGRRGFTSVVLVSSPAEVNDAVATLNGVLEGYRFNSGETYAEWRPGDKVAEYGLTALIVGGGVAAAVKMGLLKGAWKFILTAAAALWKVIAAAAVAVIAGVKSLFKRRQVRS